MLIVLETSRKVQFWGLRNHVKVIRSFVNVVKNGVDAMPIGGRLFVKSELSEEFVVFTFRDIGVGMSSEILKKLWSPLFTTKAKGIDFRLAICRRFVEAHCGCVSVDSKTGEGTTVRVDLPPVLDMKT